MTSPRPTSPGLLAALVAALLLALIVTSTAAASIRVQPGDTLSAIAARHAVSASALASANGIADPDHLVAGRLLRLPGGAAAGTGGGGGATGGHTVRAGETLSSIAARYGVSATALASANGITNPNLVVAGRRLSIPGGGGSSVPASNGSGGSGASGGHTVRPGETLSSIAARYGVSATALASANGITNPNLVVAGRRLAVPGGGAASTPLPSGGSIGAPPVPRAQVAAMITAAAARHGVDPALARAISYQESGWNHSARSHVGAIGAMQLMPYTAEWVGPSLVGRRLNPHDVRDNVEGGVAYLAWLMRQTGNPRLAAAGYYQGLNALRTRGMFDDTKRYVASVMSLYGRV